MCPKDRWSIKPTINGNIICSNSFGIISPTANSPVFNINKLSQSGVANIPITPDILALKMAVGKFPLAIATMTTEDDTVDGKTPRKKIASQRSEPVPASKNGMNIKVSIGKKRKVVACMRIWDL